MARGRQDKQAPDVAEKLLKVKISGSSSHCKANCHDSGGIWENIAIQLQKEGVQRVRGTEFSALGRELGELRFGHQTLDIKWPR